MQEPSPTSMQGRVYDGVRQRIISGEFEPGAALSELTLSNEYGVSRTPVREALKQLQLAKLVEIRPRVGTFVATPTHREIVELFQMKEILEGAAARLLASRGHVPELDLLRANVARSDDAAAVDDVDAYVPLVCEFHDLIVRGAGNDKLESHYTMLMNQLAYPRLVHASLEGPDHVVESVGEHHKLVEVIATKDGATAEHLMRQHVQASRDRLLKSISIDRIVREDAS